MDVVTLGQAKAAAKKVHDATALFTNTAPYANLGQYSSARIASGTYKSGATERLWSHNSTGLYQVDVLTGSSWQQKNLPANCATSGQSAKVVVFGGIMYGVFWNTVASKYEVYSAPLVSGATQPTWTGPLVQLATNATIIQNAIRSTTVGLFVGEYTGTPNITGGPSVLRSTDGVNFTTVLGPLATTRHIHGIYQDPYNLTHIWVTVGDASAPHWVYRSTDSGATFSAITQLDNVAWQAVAMAFTAEYVWFFSDQINAPGAYVMDRTALVPKGAMAPKYDRIPVPGGVGGRRLTDISTTSGSATITSATGAFTSADVGKYVGGANVIPHGAYITSVTNATTVVLSSNATGTGTNQIATVAGDTFFADAYQGVIDPATGWAYFVANDSSVAGTTAGIFVLPTPGGRPILLHTIYALTLPGNYEMFIEGGYLFWNRFGPMTLLGKG